MSVDRKFNIVRPTLDRLVRMPLEVANVLLLNPNSLSPLALVDGELVQIDTAGKWARATDAAAPSFFCIDDRGDYGVQATRKLTAVIGGGSFLADTVLFDSALTTIGTAVKWGTVSIEGVSRSCLVPQSGSGLILGYVMKPSAINGSKLQFLNTLT